jgi:hypothetical protein
MCAPDRQTAEPSAYASACEVLRSTNPVNRTGPSICTWGLSAWVEVCHVRVQKLAKKPPHVLKLASSLDQMCAPDRRTPEPSAGACACGVLRGRNPRPLQQAPPSALTGQSAQIECRGVSWQGAQTKCVPCCAADRQTAEPSARADACDGLRE